MKRWTVGFLGLIFVLTGSEWALGQNVTITGPTEANAGDTFTVVVSASGGQSFANGMAGLTYDPALVQFVSADSAGSIYGGFFGEPLVTTGKVSVTGEFQFSDSRTADGVLASFNFKALSGGTAVFSTQIKQSDSDPDDGRTAFNLLDGTYLTPTVSGNLTVTIKGWVAPTPTATAVKFTGDPVGTPFAPIYLQRGSGTNPFGALCGMLGNSGLLLLGLMTVGMSSFLFRRRNR